MRKLFNFVSVLTVIICTRQYATAQTPAVTFESLKLSAAPAFVILGVEPENINRPGTPEQFASAIQNAFQDGKLLTSYAMEFTPYYWKNPALDPQRFSGWEFVAPETNLFRRIAKTATFSVATSNTDSTVFGKLKPGLGVGFGARFTLIDGRPAKGKVADLLKWNEAFVKGDFLRTISALFLAATTTAQAESVLTTEVTTFKGTTLKNSRFNLLPQAFSRKMIDELASEIQREIRQSGLASANALITRKLGQYNTEERLMLARINNVILPFAKQGFMLEAAAGEAFVMQERKGNQSEHAKFAIWLTPSYRFDLAPAQSTATSLLDLTAVFRYTFNNIRDSVDVSDYFDAGLKGKYHDDRWSASLEGVYRYATDVKGLATDASEDEIKQNYTYRLTGTVEYRINDLLTLKATFGSNFNGTTTTYTDPKEIFVLGGLNVGLFN